MQARDTREQRRRARGAEFRGRTARQRSADQGSAGCTLGAQGAGQGECLRPPQPVRGYRCGCGVRVRGACVGAHQVTRACKSFSRAHPRAASAVPLVSAPPPASAAATAPPAAWLALEAKWSGASGAEPSASAEAGSAADTATGVAAEAVSRVGVSAFAADSPVQGPRGHELDAGLERPVPGQRRPPLRRAGKIRPERS